MRKIDLDNEFSKAQMERFFAGMDEHLVDHKSKAKEESPVFILQGKTQVHSIAHPGNIVTIQGLPKVGKSGVLSALLSATMSEPGKICDNLGFSGFNHLGRQIVHFDFEQSEGDTAKFVDNILRRSGLTDPPPWFKAYSFRTATIRERLLAVETAIYVADGYEPMVVSIDGVGDLVGSVNDEEESVLLVDHLIDLAGNYGVIFLLVIHENSQMPGKPRGHLGSQLERKAETNLRLIEKDGGTVIYDGGKSRNCNIPFTEGPKFYFDPELKLHVSEEIYTASKASNSINAHAALAGKAFQHDLMLTYAGLLDRLKEITELRDTAAKAKIKRLTELGVIVKEDGQYRLGERSQHG